MIKLSYMLRLIMFMAIIMCICLQVHCEQYATHVMVAQDGTGNFNSISEAVNAVPSQNQQRYYVHIKEGLYEEYITIPKDKTNVIFVGEGAYKTIISGNRSAGEGLGTYYTATVVVEGDGFMAKDVTIQNLAEPTMHQAVALATEANHTVYSGCRFLGFQDTLYVKGGIQFYTDCDIYGTVDFIFGDATVVFQSCRMLVRRPLDGQVNTITASDRNLPNGHTGIVIHNCIITAAPDLQQNLGFKTFMGRPWAVYARTIIMESMLDTLIDPNGWLEWEGKPTQTTFYAEFVNEGPGANTRVRWAKIINITEAKSFTVNNFIGGNTWIPSDVPFIPGLLRDRSTAQRQTYP